MREHVHVVAGNKEVLFPHDLMRRMSAKELVVSLYDYNKEGLVRVVASDTRHKKTPSSERWWGHRRRGRRARWVTTVSTRPA